MTTRKVPTAALVMRRPAEPITEQALAVALAPLLELLNADLDDVRELHVTKSVVRLVIVPRFRGRAQHDSAVRVTYPIIFDFDDVDEQ